ncbi:hypothetical protein KAI92_01780 [Candidatus Parcubacteria bacterium]|nr:hypothetical protein [Candidatus Parcubacteria bacterium]
MKKLKEYFLKISKIIKENIFLIFILLFAFFVRFYGIDFGYPFNVRLIWDETNGITTLMDFIQTRNIFEISSQYPILLPFIYFPVVIVRIIYLALREGIFNVFELKEYFVQNGIGNLYIVIRWYAVFFGTATVYVIYKIYRMISSNKLSAYYAATAYAFSLVPLVMSHWGKAHNGMIFFLVLSLFFIIKFEKNKTLNYFYLSLIFSSLSFSIHYIGVASFIFPILGFIFNRNKFNLSTVFKSVFVSTPIVLFFYITSYSGIISMIRNVSESYCSNAGAIGLFSLGKYERFYYVFRDISYIEPVFLSLFILIIIIKFRKIFKNINYRYILLGFLFYYFLMITVISGPEVSRWLLVFLVLLVPFAAANFSDFLIDKKINKRFVNLILVLLILPSIFVSAKWLTLLNNNTLIETTDWIENELRKDEVVYSFSYDLTTQLSYDAALFHKNENSIKSSDKINYIIENRDKFENIGSDLFFDVGNNRYENLGGGETKYIIVDYWTAGEEGKRTMIRTRKRTEEVLYEVRKYHDIKLVKTFYPTKNKNLINSGVGDYINNPLKWRTLLQLEKSGPFVEVYEVLN